jgi:hypothetical protein
MRYSFASAIGGLALLASAAASAGEIADAAAKAETLLAEGKGVEAVVAMDKAVGQLWDKLPLSFLEAHIVTSQPSGYGSYEIHPTSRFKPGEQILVYAELAGFGYGRDGDQFVIELDADVELRTKEGKILGGQANFANFSYRSRVPNREFFAVMTYNFTGFAAGDYVVVTRLRDKNSGKSGEFQLPFAFE